MFSPPAGRLCSRKESRTMGKGLNYTERHATCYEASYKHNLRLSHEEAGTSPSTVAATAAAYAAFAIDKDNVWPSLSTVANRAKLSRATVKRCRIFLVANGYFRHLRMTITNQGRNGRPVKVNNDLVVWERFLQDIEHKQ